MNPASLNFLIVDHHRDSRLLLVRSLSRRFPHATILEAEDGEPALEMATRSDLSAIITHRTREYLGAELVAKFREANPTVPIVMVSGIERSEQAFAAGANRFLLYDEWLRIGSVVREMLAAGGSGVVRVDLSAPEPGARETV